VCVVHKNRIMLANRPKRFLGALLKAEFAEKSRSKNKKQLSRSWREIAIWTRGCPRWRLKQPGPQLATPQNHAAAAANVEFTERKARERAAAHCSTCMRSLKESLTIMRPWPSTKTARCRPCVLYGCRHVRSGLRTR
jgi:hypothetical protein